MSTHADGLIFFKWTLVPWPRICSCPGLNCTQGYCFGHKLFKVSHNWLTLHGEQYQDTAYVADIPAVYQTIGVADTYLKVIRCRNLPFRWSIWAWPFQSVCLSLFGARPVLETTADSTIPCFALSTRGIGALHWCHKPCTRHWFHYLYLGHLKW
jgi:hypothetical protein